MSNASAGPSTIKPAARIFVGGNFHTMNPIFRVRNRASAEDYRLRVGFKPEPGAQELPTYVTLGFRRLFWKVFSEVFEVEQPGIDFEWLGRSWHLESIWIADSAGAEITVHLEDKRNIFVMFELTSPGVGDLPSVKRLANGLKLNEQESLFVLIDVLKSHEPCAFLGHLAHSRNLPGRYTHVLDTHIGYMPDFMCMLFFHCYCLLLIWTINRFQAEVALDDSGSVDQLSDVLRIRANIINVERFLLTTNLTNDPDLALAVTNMRKMFGLRDKFLRYMQLNESIERYIATASQISGERRARRINYLVFLFTTVSLPLALIQSLLSYNNTADMVHEEMFRLLTSREFAKFAFNTAIIYFAILLMGYAMLRLTLFLVSRVELAWLRRLSLVAPIANQKKRIFSGSRPR